MSFIPPDIYTHENPCVSVIMATYNRAEYLSRSIPSFISQTYRSCELIVVDDGSDDDTFIVVNEFLRSHSNIRFIKHSNRKLSLSKNAGIKAAAGQFIAFLDSDDEYKPDYLEKRVDYMKANPEVDLLEGGAIIIGDEYVKDKNDLSKLIHLSECCIGPTLFGKTEIFNSLGGFDKQIQYSEDSCFMEKAKQRYNVRKIDHPGYIYYRNTPGSICNSV